MDEDGATIGAGRHISLLLPRHATANRSSGVNQVIVIVLLGDRDLHAS